jgi:hypothetical protein
MEAHFALGPRFRGDERPILCQGSALRSLTQFLQ